MLYAESMTFKNMTPGDYPNADAFNYERWTPNTTITFINVPWSSDYKDVVVFDSTDAKKAYFEARFNEGFSIRLDRMTNCPPGAPIRVNVPFNNAYMYNYLMVTNNNDYVGDRARTMYYFIQDVKFVSGNTTELSLMLDVWQSFGDSIQLGRAYVEQGHVGIADQKNFDNYGRSYLMEPEGLETGAEMVVLSHEAQPIGTEDSTDKSTMHWDILVWSNTALDGDWGSLSDPQMRMSEGTLFQGLPQAASCYIFKNADEFTTFVKDVAKAPHVAQGIMAIHAVPNGMFDTTGKDALTTKTYKYAPSDSESIAGTITQVYAPYRSAARLVVLSDNPRAHIDKYLGTRYKNLNKFKTAPYSMIEITTYTGAPLLLRPESVLSDNMKVRLISDMGLPSPKVIITPTNYNTIEHREPVPQSSMGSAVTEVMLYKGLNEDFLDVQTGIYDFPSLSILNNSYLAYMTGNAHSIAFQHSAADWSQTKALQGNQLSFDQSTAGIALNSQMNGIGNNQAMWGAGIGVVSNLAGFGASSHYDAGPNPDASNHQMNVYNAAKSLNKVGAAIGAATSVANTANSVVHNNQRTNAANGNAAYMRDTNKAYADFAAKGDYAQSIASINARTQDMKVVAPTTLGQVGGEKFALVHLEWNIFCKVKCIQPASLRAIGEYWLRYGYKINRFVSFDYRGLNALHVMDKFTYWRLSESYIRTSYCPEQYRMAIRGILEKGVTVWRNPNDIGVLDTASNNPIPGNYILN